MKKLKKTTVVLLTILCLSAFTANAQVSINTDGSTPDGSAMLDLKSSDKGFLPPRMTFDQRNAISSPVPGLTIFNTQTNCVQFYDGSAWVDICDSFDPFINPAGSGSLLGKTCFDIAENNDDINGCGELSARTSERADFNQSSTYSQAYTFTPDGTVSNVRFYYLNTNGTVIIAISGDDPSNNISSPVVATVTYSQDLSSTDPDNPGDGEAYGLTASDPLTATVYAVYNDDATNTGTDRQIDLSVDVKDCACCGAYVADGVWKDFMCHNLGANYDLDPFTPHWDINGAYWQWGRLGPADHRQTNNTSNFAARPTGSDAGTANNGSVSGWSQSNASNSAWHDASKTVNDPCPDGYRVPTYTQLIGVTNASLNSETFVGSPWTNNITNYNTGVLLGSRLFLPAAGYRILNTGGLTMRGSNGVYYSSTYYNTSYGWYLFFNSSSANTNNIPKTCGLSVRCIAE